jgi:hypothetical protein
MRCSYPVTASCYSNVAAPKKGNHGLTLLPSRRLHVSPSHVFTPITNWYAPCSGNGSS